MPGPSVLRHPRLALAALRHPRAFALGLAEARSSCGVTFDGDPESPRSRSYDAGRDLRLLGRA